MDTSSSWEGQIQPLLDTKPNLEEKSDSESEHILSSLEKKSNPGEKSKWELEGERMIDNFTAASDYRDADQSCKGEDESSESSAKEDESSESSEGEEDEEEVSTDVEAEIFSQRMGEDDDFPPPGTKEVDFKKVVRYWRQIRRTEGFELKYEDYPGSYGVAPYFPLRLDCIDHGYYSDLVNLTKMAIDYYNSNNVEKLAFKELVSVITRGFMYHITFEAISGEGKAEIEIFQAKVYDGINDTEVLLCRKKPLEYAPVKKRTLKSIKKLKPYKSRYPNRV